jgi:hypothetical protein
MDLFGLGDFKLVDTLILYTDLETDLDFYSDSVTINVNRTTYSNNSIISTVSVTGPNTTETFSGYTLENSNPPNSNLPVPAGVYTAFLRADYTPYRIELDHVPNATNIQFHIGNSASDVVGCFAVGLTSGTDYIYNSKDALLDINAVISSNGGRKIIVIIK